LQKKLVKLQHLLHKSHSMVSIDPLAAEIDSGVKKIHFTSKSCILLYWQRYCTALRQPNCAAWNKEWNYGTFTDGATYVRLGRAAIMLVLYKYVNVYTVFKMIVLLFNKMLSALLYHC